MKPENLGGSFMKFLRFSIAIAATALCLYHSYAWRSYETAIRAMTESGMGRDGLLEVQLALIHMGLGSGFLVLAISAFLEWRFGKVAAITANVGIMAIFSWWFFEKYRFLTVVHGLRPESPEYQTWISEIGFFRGATTVDFWLLIPTSAVVIAVLIWCGYATFGKQARFEEPLA